MQDFCDAYEELLEAYKASEDDPALAHARMVGALKVIIPFGADAESLAQITKDLRDSTKRQTLELLSRETF